MGERWKTDLGMVLALAVVVVVTFLGSLDDIGVWEPWESTEIMIAQDYVSRAAPPEIQKATDPSYNWAVPRLGDKPVARPLLKTWLISLGMSRGELQAGELEHSARSPIALLTLFFTMGLFFWMRRRSSAQAALIAAVGFATIPAIYVGVHNLSSELLFVLSSSVAVLGFYELVFATNPRKRWLAGGLFGLGLAATFLDQRLFGFDLVLIVLAAWAVAELVFEQYWAKQDSKSLVGKAEIAAGLCFAAIAGGSVLWALGKSGEKGIAPHALQVLALIIPWCIAAIGFSLARKGRVVRALISLPGLAGLGLAVLVGVVVAHTYGAANPTLLEQGEILGKIPVLTFLTENEIFTKSLVTQHVNFAIIVRQIGFSLFPWAGVVLLALGYLSRAEQHEDQAEALSEDSSLRRLLLVWIAFGFCAVVAATALGHFYFPAYVPLMIATGMMFADEEFWKQVRLRPLLAYGMGFAAICVVLILGKDLERFPLRFIEVYTELQDKFKLPEDFHLGKSLKVIKYGAILLLATYFFGLGSTLVVWARGLKAFPAKFRAWRGARREGVEWTFDHSSLDERAIEKEEIRTADGRLGQVLRWFETPLLFSLVLTLSFTGIAGVFLYKYLPDFTHHTSQRGVFETFQNSAKSGELLYRYDVVGKNSSVYLADVPTISNSREFSEKFAQEERFYSVIPRKSLARVNYEMRKKYKRNLTVLDARSSRLLLVSNRLAEGEVDYNFVAESIIEDESVIQYPIEFETASGKEHPVFDGQLEFVGFSLDHPQEADGYASYNWGETAVIDYYFKVLKRVPSSQKIFLHVDYPGNRINGDHYPNDGDFPTNYWLPGDLVRSRQHLSIENYSTPGVYSLNFGFFLGSKRMKVLPKEAHDGGNRVQIGKFRVSSL